MIPSLPLRNVKLAILENAAGATLMADFNLLTSGQAVTVSGSFPAEWVANKTFLSVQAEGDRIVIAYTE